MLLKFIILFFVFIYSTVRAYVTNFPENWYMETYNNLNMEAPRTEVERPKDSEPTWVMDLESNMLDKLELRKAGKDEAKEFESSVAPLIERDRNKNSRKPPLSGAAGVAREPPTHVIQNSKGNNKKAIKEIMTMVNKYILSGVGVDRDSHMPDTTDVYNTPKLALYFKGIYSAVIIKYGRTEWKFVFSYPSPLPSWFYTNHEHCAPANAPIQVPEYVQTDFYATFSQLLKMFFRTEM